MRGVLKFVIIVFLGLSCAGCLSRSIAIQTCGASSLNTDQRGRSLPVVVRIYQLSSLEAFHDASFSALWEHDRKTLNKTLLNRQEIIVLPHHCIQLHFPHQPSAKFLAAIGRFRQAADQRWKQAVAISAWRTVLPKTFALQVTDNHLTWKTP